MHVAGRNAQAGKLRRHTLDLVGFGNVVDVDLADLPRTAAEDAPRYVMMAFVFVGDESIGQDALRLDHAVTMLMLP